MFGDPGRGRTVAVRAVLGDVPAGWKVTWVPVSVRPPVAGTRRAVFDALALPGRFPHTPAPADAAVAGALGEVRVLVADEAQRMPAPCLEYLQSPWDHPRHADHAGAVPCGQRAGAGPAAAVGIEGRRVVRDSSPGQNGSGDRGDRLPSAVAHRPGPGSDADRPVVRTRQVPQVGRFDCPPAERAAHHR